MKLVITQSIKHRLVGVLVVLSVATIFLPAVMKRSNQRFEENISLALKLPVRPKPPKVAIPNQRILFKSVKVAHVQIPATPTVRPASIIAKAEPLKTEHTAKAISVIASIPQPSTPVKPKLPPVTQNLAKVTMPVKIVPAVVTNLASKKSVFSIQVATFSQKNNADSLIHRLQQKGYTAAYHKVVRAQGEFYQVVVGQLNQRGQAIDLQKKLATNMQLNGLIVKIG